MRTSLLGLLLFFMSAFGYAQQCTPDDTISTPGIYPEFLDTAILGESYEHVLQVLAVRDTNVIFGGQPISATVDSIVIDDIQGLPGNFQYGCYPANCVFTNDSVGCAALFGDPEASDVGEHPLSIIITSYARWNTIKLPVTDTITDFVLVVLDSATAGLKDLQQSTVQLFPNPSHGAWLDIRASSSITTYQIIDQQGKLVLEGAGLKSTELKVSVSDLPSGLYTVKTQTDKGIVVRKWLRMQ